jgi:D-alanine--poly(phosphoribitol) ligase subunit 1
MSRRYDYNLGLAFAQIAAERESSPALRMPGGEVVTYGRLNRLANRIAALCSARGIVRRDVVGIVHTKTAACYATMLACLKLGAIYVNVDDQNPPARLERIVASCRPRLIVTDDSSGPLRDGIAALAIPILELRAATADFGPDDAAPEPEGVAGVTGADPAYVMYTSGSTGIPKGAIMTHANVLNFGAWTGSRFGITADDALSNVNPMYFDNSVFDFYAALLNGASLVPITREALQNPADMLTQLEAANASIWFSVPSLLIYMTSLRLLTADRLPSIRSFVFGGEGYPKPELRKLFAAFGETKQLINVYGPTECTCICSAWNVRPEDLEDPRGFVTLGRIAGNFGTLILDDEQRPAEAGSPGELCLLGPQVGAGYINDPERTAAGFAASPTNRAWPERMYRTGDMVKLRADGQTIDFVGRKDHQIKHMGYRIELEEIEAALDRIDGVVQSAVVHVADRTGFKTLVAYVATDEELSEKQLAKQLLAELPPYMMPQRFSLHRTLPKNANGKVDRVSLAARAGADGAQ